MCSRCVEIDERIMHLKELGSRLLDGKTLRSIEILVERLAAEKAALHPEGKE
jgi:hypothetical protein